MSRSPVLQSTRRALATLGLATAGLLALAPAASAGVPSISVTPTTLPAGSSITVSGVGCFGDSAPEADVFVYAGTVGGNTDPGGHFFASGVASPNVSTGNWSMVVTIPAATTPVGTYTVHGSCDSDTSAFEYRNVVIHVTAATTTTAAPTCGTTTTAAPTTTVAPTTTLAATTTTGIPVNQRLARAADPSCPTTTTTPAVSPATAVPATPTFTG